MLPNIWNDVYDKNGKRICTEQGLVTVITENCGEDVGNYINALIDTVNEITKGKTANKAEAFDSLLDFYRNCVADRQAFADAVEVDINKLKELQKKPRANRAHIEYLLKQCTNRIDEELTATTDLFQTTLEECCGLEVAYSLIK